MKGFTPPLISRSFACLDGLAAVPMASVAMSLLSLNDYGQGGIMVFPIALSQPQ
jgi:hypothetical protein